MNPIVNSSNRSLSTGINQKVLLKIKIEEILNTTDIFCRTFVQFIQNMLKFNRSSFSVLWTRRWYTSKTQYSFLLIICESNTPSVLCLTKASNQPSYRRPFRLLIEKKSGPVASRENIL